MIHHIGVVAKNIKDVEPLLALVGVLGKHSLVDEQSVPTWKCKCYLYRFGESGTLFEVVVPHGGKLLDWSKEQQWPMTLHHLALKVDNIDGKCQTLSHFGVKLLSDQPVDTFNKWRVNFVHPSYCGVLLELVEVLW